MVERDTELKKSLASHFSRIAAVSFLPSIAQRERR
jgi:hypothetical protein